jgi:hypothetical protein
MIPAPTGGWRTSWLTAACLAACLVAPGLAHGQHAARLLPARIDVAPLLQSFDPQRQAWGAWIAGRDRIEQAQPMLEQLVAATIDGDPYAPPVDFALDALIELDAELPTDLLARIAERRPIEGLILLSHLDDGAADTVLLAMLDRERGYGWFAAANQLFFRRPAGYVAHLLAGLRIQVRLTISDDGGAMSGSGAGGSIGCGTYQSMPGMPPWPSYHLTTSAAPGYRVLATGPTPIYYDRRIGSTGTGRGGGGLSIDGPSGADRLRYVAAVTGQTPALLGSEHHAVRRRQDLDVDAIEAELRRDVVRRHGLWLRHLVGSGFLTEAEGAGLAVDVEVTVFDSERRDP